MRKGDSMREKRPKQTDKILAYMQRHKDGITALVALRECGSFDLAGRIRDLREMGYEINSEYVQVKTAEGKTRVKRYWLV